MQIEVMYKGEGTERTVTVNIEEDLLEKAEQVAKAGRGRFAVISEHVSFNNYKIPCVSDILVVSRPNYNNYLRRMIAKLKTLDFRADVAHTLAHSKAGRKFLDKCKEKDVEPEDVFNARKASVIEKSQEKLDGTFQSGAKRGHDNCYVSYKGVTLHLLTERGADKHKYPVLDDDGLMTVVSVMLPWFQVARDKKPKSGHSHCKGEPIPVNSGPPVLAERVMMQAINLPTYKTFSLGLQNFHKIAIDHSAIMGVILADDHKINQDDLRAVAGVGYEDAEAQNAEAEEQVS